MEQIQNTPKRPSKFGLRFWEDSWQALVINLTIMVALGLVLLFFIFYVWMPSTTNHGESVSVPNLEGRTLAEVEEALRGKEFRFEVIDTTYNPDAPPSVVLQQKPRVNSPVKLNRKIYLTMNAAEPPTYPLPKLHELSLRSAVDQINSYRFKVGKLTYVPDLSGTVLKVMVDGKEISKEEIHEKYEVAQGTKIDLVLGDKMGDTEFPIPNVVGMSFTDAEFQLKGIGLNIDKVHYEKVPGKPVGEVLRQEPMPNDTLRVKPGAYLNLWVVEYVPEDDEATEETP